MSDKERDELMNALAETIGSPYAAGSDLSLRGRLVDRHMHIEGNLDVGNIASDVIADGWAKPRTITTAEELDALPQWSAILDSHGDVAQKLNGRWHFPETAPMGASKVLKYGASVTVIHEPTA